MKIIETNVKPLVFNERGKKAEYCGRICYNSINMINDESYIKFLRGIKNSGHLSVLEHERVNILIDTSEIGDFNINTFEIFISTLPKPIFSIYRCLDNHKKIILSANVRAWYEANFNATASFGFYNVLKNAYPYIFDVEDSSIYKNNQVREISDDELPEYFEDYAKSYTYLITCSRACSHQLVRHRIFSFSQQSQRYCNYSKEKFNHEINFILPSCSRDFMINALAKTEEDYFEAIEKYGMKPEDARALLPNATATLIAMTGTKANWKDFVSKRNDPHAQEEIRKIAQFIANDLNLN